MRKKLKKKGQKKRWKVKPWCKKCLLSTKTGLPACLQVLACYLIIALLLSYEQQLKNPFNLNRMSSEQMLSRSSSGSKEQGCLAFSGERIKDIIVLGLKYANSTELLITLFQIVYYLTETREVFNKDDLQVVTLASIQSLVAMIGANEEIEKSTFLHHSLRIVVEVLVFCILFRIIERVPATKGRDPLLDTVLNINILEKLKVWHKFKPYLKSFAESLIHKLCQYPAYYKILNNEMKFEVFVLINFRSSVATSN